jgi:hypothetical protein
LKDTVASQIANLPIGSWCAMCLWQEKTIALFQSREALDSVKRATYDPVNLSLLVLGCYEPLDEVQSVLEAIILSL